MASNLHLLFDRAEAVSPEIDRFINRLIDRTQADASGRTTDPFDMMTEVLNFAALANEQIAEHKARISQLESLVLTDDLTGIGNRRAFIDVLNRTLSAARRYHRGGVIGFFDLNDFKTINDTLGHPVGDRVLKTVATVLQAGVRREDFAARIGGDEFAVILAHCLVEDGTARLEALKADIDQAQIDIEDNQLAIRASLGIEPIDPEKSAEQIMAEADRRMYMEKRRVSDPA